MSTSATTTVTARNLSGSGPRYLIPIKGYFTLMNIVALCLIFPTISYFFYNRTTSFRDGQLERAVNDQTFALEQRAAQLLRSLSHSGSQAIAGYNYTFLNNLIRRAVSNDQELLACQFFSKEEEDAAAGIGLPWLTMEQDFTPPHRENEVEQFPDQEADSDRLPVFFSEYRSADAKTPPLLLARAPVSMGGRIWGFVYAAFSLEQRNQDIEHYRQEWDIQIQQYQFFLFAVTALFFVLGVIAAFLFTRPLVYAIQGLRDGVDRVTGGDLSHTIGFDRIAFSEFTDLGRSFNTMTDSLRISRQQLAEYSHSLEEKVEERTQALQEAQAELVNQAHKAGMAEMAVGVLHNIGNAITPAKVEALLLVKQLRKSRLRTDLAQTLEPLPNLIANSEIPAKEKEYLQKVIKLLPGSIAEEYNQAIDSLNNISDKHHYIENIISLQMHYARLHGSPDLIDCNRVIRDGLKILEEQLRQNQVEIVTDLQAEARVRLEESKLLQVLVNLIKNSYEAMANSDTDKRRLQISSREQKGEVVIRVTDSGCGFDEEARKKMFTFGYSSKARGSGFGLHSCANYLIANNGSITAFSEGPGLGAEFVVHLPTAESESGEKST